MLRKLVGQAIERFFESHSEEAVLSRRKFIVGLGALGGAVALAPLLGSETAEAAMPLVVPEDEDDDLLSVQHRRHRSRRRRRRGRRRRGRRYSRRELRHLCRDWRFRRRNRDLCRMARRRGGRRGGCVSIGPITICD